MMFLFFLAQAFLTTVSAQGTDAALWVNLTESVYTWSTENPYPAEDQTIIVQVEEQYIILVTVKECDISSEDGDFLLIKSGTSVDDGGSGRVFVYNLKSPREYVVYSNTVFLSFKVFGFNEQEKKGVTVTFEKFREQTVSTEDPISTTVWPEHSTNDSIFYNVSLTTATSVDFNDNETIWNLRWAISGMAVAFSEEELIPLAENITEDNVVLHDVRNCRFYWPNRDKCVWINFSLPLVLEENRTVWTGYELKTENLEKMWLRYSEQYLRLIGFALYDKPGDDYMLLMWLLLTGGVIGVFAIVLFLIRYLMIKLSQTKSNNGNLDDMDSIISKHRDSSLSLDPHPLQSIPQLFETDYPMYEPGMSPAPEGYENPAMSDNESEDEVVNTRTLTLSTSTRLHESET